MISNFGCTFSPKDLQIFPSIYMAIVSTKSCKIKTSSAYLLTRLRNHSSGSPFLYFIFLLLFLPHAAYNQCMLSGLDLSSRMAMSDTVISGSIHLQNTYIRPDGNIVSSYQIISSSDTFVIEKLGGSVGQLTQVIQPDVTLKEGESGLFFVKRRYAKNLSFSCGPYSYIQYDPTDQTFYEVISRYSKEEIYQHLAEYSYQLNILEKPLAVQALLSPPTILDISPDTITAGTESVLTITGSNFGYNAVGQASIEFRNADVGVLINAYQPVPPNHILSWTDTKIKVIIPGRDPKNGNAGAGSGSFRVKNTMGELAYSPPLIVLYNRFVIGASQQLALLNDNDHGGYTFTYNKDFINNSPAREAFKRALKTWQCEVESNIDTALLSTTFSCPANDGVNIVAFDDHCPLSAGLLAQTTHWYITCSDGQPFFLEMDLIFDKQAFWNYDSLYTNPNKFDFESTALHELGHFHGIGHSLTTGNTMFPNIFPGTTLRTLDTNTLMCAKHISSDSEKADNACNINNYQQKAWCKDTCNLSFNVIPDTNCLNGKMIFYGSLNHKNNGNFFEVLVDDDLFNIFSYEADGVTLFEISMVADGKVHSIKIKDNTDYTCMREILVTTLNCSCDISSVLISTTPCSDDSLFYELTVTNQNNSSNGYRLFLDGQLYGNAISYSHENGLPITIKVTGDGKLHAITVEDEVETGCKEAINFIAPDCLCSMTGEVKFLQCEEDKALYEIELLHQNNSKTFWLYFNDTLLREQPVNYSSGQETKTTFVIPAGTSGTINVIDVDKKYCTYQQTLQSPDCSCRTSVEIVSISPCFRDSMDFYFKVTYNNLLPGSYDVIFNNEIIKTIPFLPSATGVIFFDVRLKGDNSKAKTLLLKNNGFVACDALIKFDIPECACTLSLDVLPLNDCDENGLTKLSCTLYHPNPRSNNFIVNFNGNEMQYPYTHGDTTLFTLLLPGDGASYEVNVSDVTALNCHTSVKLNSYNCDCGLSVSLQDISPCTNDNLQTIGINFINNIKTSLVNIFLDGKKINDLPLSSEEYNTKPYTITILGDGEIKTIVIQDITDSTCTSTLYVPTSDCGCISWLSPTLIQSCDAFGNNLWKIVFNNFEGVFNIFIDGALYKQIDESNAAIDTILPIIGDGKAHHLEFRSADNTCYKSLDLLSSLCECINDVKVDTDPNCSEFGMVVLYIKIPMANYPTTANIYLDGNKMNSEGILLSTEAETLLTYFVPGDGNQHLLLLSTANNTCMLTKTSTFPQCDCTISSTLSKISDCEEDGFENYVLLLESKHYSADSFSIFLDGIFLSGKVHKNNQSTFTFKIKGDNKSHEVLISNASNVCTKKIVIPANDCSCKFKLNASISQPCITDFESKLNCTLNIMHPTSDKFKIIVDGMHYSYMIYNSTNIQEFDLLIPSDGNHHTVSVADEVNTSCRDSVTVLTEKCYVSDTCTLKFLTLKNTLCSNGLTQGDITFTAKYNANKKFTLFVNEKPANDTPLAYDPSGINHLTYTSECGIIHLLLTEGKDAACGIDTFLEVTKEVEPFFYYPNPVSGDQSFIMENIDVKDYDKLLFFAIYDQLGRRIHTQEILGKQKMQIVFNNLLPMDGLYFFTLGSRKQYKGKVVWIK